MTAAERVAHRVVAEKLTKQWVMGIRRGWLTLMQPTIASWSDVQKALGKLLQFVANLRDQIRFVRPGVARLLDDKFETKLNKALDNLEEAIKEARSRALHWQQVDEDPDTYGRGTFTKEQGEHMFRLFRDNFAEASNTSEPIRGGGGRHRPVDLTDLLDRVLKLLREDAAILQKHDEANPESPFKTDEAFTEFDLQGVKVVVDDKTLRPGQINAYVKWLLQAKKLLQNRGFDKVWRGVLFIQCEECGGENPYGKEFGVGGDYTSGPDRIRVYMRPGSGMMQLLIHELGHRWWFKFMNREGRLRFEEWVEKGLSPVSRYGGTKPSEAFAEAFAYYVTGQPMTADQVETFKQVALGRRVAAAERVARRYQAKVRGKHYKVNKRKLKDLNDPEARKESMQYYGGYSEYRIEIVPIKDIKVPPVWNPGRYEEALKYLQSGQAIDPIRAVKKGSKWEIEDGIHRTNASRDLGWTHIPVITSKWVETPEALVPEEPEKARIPVGTWIKLREPFAGRQYGWVDEQLSASTLRGVRRWRYGLALVREGEDWPDVGDFNDTEFDPATPPTWGPKTRQEVEANGWTPR